MKKLAADSDIYHLRGELNKLASSLDDRIDPHFRIEQRNLVIGGLQIAGALVREMKHEGFPPR